MVQRLLRLFSLIVVGAGLGAGVVSAWATSPWPGDWPGRVGRVVEAHGTVQVLDRDERQWMPATPNRPVTAGDHIVADRGARAEVRIGSTTLRLAGQTDLHWVRLDDEAIVLRLNAGSLALRVTQRDVAREIAVDTPHGRLQPAGRGHFRVDVAEDATHATAWSGEMRFESSDSELVIPAGQHAEMWMQGPHMATHYQWQPVRDDDFAAWVARDDREQRDDETVRYVSVEMTGWEDLDRHGRWHRHPQHGSVWVPAVVPGGWAPYRMGHWAWISPWGWTWIDDARWGFAPFHYGRWLWWGGRWCWAPGARQARPTYAPALVAWVGVHGSVGVSVSAPIAWLPLGPRDPYHPHRGRRDDHRDDRDDRRHDRDRHRPTPAPGTVPTGPIMYNNQGVPGAVTVVPRDAFTDRRPLVPVAPIAIEPRIGPQPLLPLAPPTRVVRPVPMAPTPAPGPVQVQTPAAGPVPVAPPIAVPQPTPGPGAIRAPSPVRPTGPMRELQREPAPVGVSPDRSTPSAQGPSRVPPVPMPGTTGREAGAESRRGGQGPQPATPAPQAPRAPTVVPVAPAVPQATPPVPGPATAPTVRPNRPPQPPQREEPKEAERKRTPESREGARDRQQVQ
jgi:hypothetical protein